MSRKNNPKAQNMPQDSRRSGVYRSFVTCDDPNGVVECGTIRKSKANSQKVKHKIESQRAPENLNTSSAYKAQKEKMVSEGITGRLHNPSSFQLLEVSKGAQKLNQTIDSWSRGLSFDGQTKDIAKDLLRGAIDLQESLIMLGKLQEASQCMARLKKEQKQKQKSEREWVDEERIERMDSNQFRDIHDQIGFQRPRLSADAASRKSFEEIKKVIRDGLVRQNLLPDTATDDKAYFDQRKLDLASEIATTSSSQSSMLCTNSSIARTPQKKAKSPNLIARLMGLEEMPSKPVHTAPQKQLEAGKTPKQRRPIFDIDMPKARKPQFVVQKVDAEQRTLKDILETMQFKGLLKTNSVGELKSQSHHSNNYRSKQRFVHNMPPIVIMKPLHLHRPESPGLFASNIIEEEEPFVTKEVPRRLELKKELPPKTVECKERALNSNKRHGKLETEETPIKGLGQEEETEDRKEVLAKLEEKQVKPKERTYSSKMKASAPVSLGLHKKEASYKKSNKIQQAIPSRRKPTQEDLKSRNVPKTQDQAKAITTKLRKTENGSTLMRNQLSRQQRTTPHAISKGTTQTIFHDFTDPKQNQMKREQSARKAPVANAVSENLEREDDAKRNNLPCENDSVLITANITPTDQLPAKEQTEASEIQIEDHFGSGESYLCEVTSPSTQHERSIKSAQEANDCISHSGAERESCNARTNLKALLLSSPSFLHQADELFDHDVNQPIVLETCDIKDLDLRLSLDCANELMERKILQDSERVHPLIETCRGNSRICFSLGQLVEEVCDGVENLRCYSKLAGENLPMDSLYAILKRDIRCKGVVSGIWNLGWRNGFSVDDAEQVVGDIEKLVLSGLIEEVLTDYVL